MSKWSGVLGKMTHVMVQCKLLRVTILLPELEKHGKTLRSNLENFEMKIPPCVLVYMECYVISVFPFLFASSFSSK